MGLVEPHPQSSRLVSRTPLHCGAEEDRGDRSGADPVYLGTLRVSSLAHQPAADAGRGVALLRWPRRNGATHPGAARGLRAEEDSHSCFCGQRPLSGSSSAGLQLGHGFSADMSPGRMAKPYLEQTALQTLLVAGRTYTPAEPTYSSVREFAPHPKVGERDTPSDS